MKASSLFLGNLLMVIVTIIFGFNLPVQKLLIPAEMSSVQVAVCRVVGGAILFWILSLFLKRQKIDRGDWWVLVVSGAVCVFGFMWLYAIAIQYSSIIDVALVLTSQPVMIICIDAVLYKMRISKPEIFGLVLSLAGAVFVIIADGRHASVHASNPMLGDLAAVGCSVCYSFYISLTRRAAAKYSALTLNKWLFLFASIPAIPFLFGMHTSHFFVHPSWAGAWQLGFVVILASFTCYFLIPAAIKKIGSDIVGIYAYLTPVAAAIIGIAMKLDVLKWEQPVAFAVILTGVVIFTKAKQKLKTEGKLYRIPKPQ